MLLNCGVGESLDCKEIQPVHPKGDPSWVFIGRTDAKSETPILWPPDVKSWLIGKDSDAGRALGQEEKGTTEDEMAGWHHWLDGHESGWTLGDGGGHGGLACCDSWSRKESDVTEQLNWTESYSEDIGLPFRKSVLPAFRRCSVVVPHADLSLMYLWGRRWSPHLTPPPSWKSNGYYLILSHLYS